MGIFSRPSTGDRMDRAQEKNHRRHQTKDELKMEQQEAKLWDYEAGKGRPWRGSRSESNARKWGK